jgi:hypothetical protein
VRSEDEMCPHGLVGFCPDCPPRSFTVGEEAVGPRSAVVKGKTVMRTKEDGSLDWATVHFTKHGARRAARLYEQEGIVKGFRP